MAAAVSIVAVFCTGPSIAISCPPASSLVAREGPQGKEERCVLPGSEKRHGPFRTWYRDGNPREEGAYRFGKPQGTWTYYYPNGQKRMEGNWHFGKVQGVWTYWYDNGKRESMGRFRNGEREGTWSYWDTDGQLRFEANWKNGVLDLDGSQASAGQHGEK